MTIEAAVTHRTTYTYDRLVALQPHVVRLRPAPHCRTPILSYSLKIEGGEHFLNWLQDPFGNWQARLVFPERVRQLDVVVDVVARMDAINPFDFFVEESADTVPFQYDQELMRDLAPYLAVTEGGALVEDLTRSLPHKDMHTVDFLVAVNQRIQSEIDYVIRMEPGVQRPEETMRLGRGSCRDSAWLIVQVMRKLGYAARFVSGYLIQLAPDMEEVDGPSGPTADFTDLHAWAEVYVPGAGWIGLDGTSGLFAGEGHIPLAATPDPRGAAPITGAHEVAEVEFDFAMKVERVRETPRITLPYTDDQWDAIKAAGETIDGMLKSGDVRLTMGGEPTFVAALDRDAPEWNIDAVGPTKRTYADTLIRRLRDRFAPNGMLHYGQGKWYPGEVLPRWAFAVYWRADGEPLWTNPELIARENVSTGAGSAEAQAFTEQLAERLGFESDVAQPVFEDPADFLLQEHQLPINVDVSDNKLEDPQERSRLIRAFDRGLNTPAAYVLPLQEAQARSSRRGRRGRWRSERWQTRRGALFLIPGDSPAGFRLPLRSLAWMAPEVYPQVIPMDPFAARGALPAQPPRFQSGQDRDIPPGDPSSAYGFDQPVTESVMVPAGAGVRTALVVEPRDGRLCIFLPPLTSADTLVDLLGAIEETAEDLGLPVHLEGYTPPFDPRLNVIKVTPDPGVVEVNIHPARSWAEQVHITETLYEEARQCRLDTSKFETDGKPTGSGGGNHIVVGGATPADSPFLRRPDLLASLVRYWQNHPSLSYLFSGLFIGPTSQAPRVDEARMETLYELEIALAQVPHPEDATGADCPPWLVDRLFRNLLVDVSGNTHRAEICIDKLYSPDGPTGRLGLVEFRAFEMPPHARMSLAQQLVLRALIARFWKTPYTGSLRRFGPVLHDRYLLPHFIWQDFVEVLAETGTALGLNLDPAWFHVHYDWRFPKFGDARHGGIDIELRAALEPWHVLGEEGAVGGTARFVDSSIERLQVTVKGDGILEKNARYKLACNGIEVPLSQTGEPDTGVSGIRFRSWLPPRCLHPTIPVHAPLVFDVVDTWNGRSIGGCTYYSQHPGGRNPEARPINALEAEGRMLARFEPWGHTPGPFTLRSPKRAGEMVHTLDLRLQ